MDGEGSKHAAVTCAAWIRRTENQHLVLLGKKGSGIEFFSFNSKTTSLSSSPKIRGRICSPIGPQKQLTLSVALRPVGSACNAKYELEDGQDVVSVAVHPSGDDVVCSTAKGCILLELYGRENNLKILKKDLPPLHDVGIQKCLAFSVDGSRFATGGEDGHLRVFEWPSLRILLDEPSAHKSFRDLDFSLDSEFLASTSVDGSARIWKTNEGVPLTSLTRNSDEKIECCRFSQDGTKPFLFCTVQNGDRVVTGVWDISTWNKIGYKRLSRKPISVLSTSMDGKYLAYGSNDGDLYVVEVKKMEIRHWSKKLHLGTRISSIEFCPSESIKCSANHIMKSVWITCAIQWTGLLDAITTICGTRHGPGFVERVVLSTSDEWGAVVTRLDLREWKEWQIYMVLLGLFLLSAVLFYLFFQNSDSFWNFPLGRGQPTKPVFGSILSDPQTSDDQGVW